MGKSYLSITALFLAFSLSVVAQTASEVFSKLTFETPKALYYPKGRTANLRQAPNVKSRLINVGGTYNGYTSWIPECYIVNDEGENASWITTHVQGKSVFISKSVMTKLDVNPLSAFHLKSVQDRIFTCEVYNEDFYEYGYNVSWSVAKLKGNSNLWLCVNSDYYNNECHLRLGKLVDGVLVFKYSVLLRYRDSLEGINKWKIESEIGDESEGELQGQKIYYLFASTDFTLATEFYPLLSKLTEPMVYSFFKDVIENNETDYFYLPSYLFDKKWID